MEQNKNLYGYLLRFRFLLNCDYSICAMKRFIKQIVYSTKFVWRIKQVVLILSVAILLICCGRSGTVQSPAESSSSVSSRPCDSVNVVLLERLTVYTLQYSRVELVCGQIPSKKDSSVIFCAEAAFTGELLEEFRHANIAGDHVSGGERFRGYRCKRNTGAFAFYDGRGHFAYKTYDALLEEAASHGGMAFGQEMIIHDGKAVPKIRKDSNVNEFRALCDYLGHLCIIDSRGRVKYGDFVSELLTLGVTEALYLDMGPGWNYSWWRDGNGQTHEIHGKRIKYTTN